MDLILWRHADAEDGHLDMLRKLTKKGRGQATLVADWLNERLTKPPRILVSPAVRARQTADALGRDYEVDDRLAPGADATGILVAAGWPDAKGSVLVVGHQPELGRVASLLLAGAEAEWSIKKGGVWWLSNRTRREETQTVLRFALSPDML